MSLPIPEPQPDPEQVSRIAERIVSSGDFDEPEPSVLERILEWIGDRLSQVGGTVGGSGGSAVLSWIVLAVAAAVLIWIAWKVIAGLNPIRRPDDDPDELDVTILSRRSVAELRREAEELHGSQEWRLAVRGWYRVLVASLVEERVIEDVAGWTPREVLASVPDGSIRDIVASATDLFERVWYADHPATESSAVSLQDLAERARHASRERPTRARAGAAS